MNELDQKIVSNFGCLIVRKDLTKFLKGGSVVPSYVLEYLLDPVAPNYQSNLRIRYSLYTEMNTSSGRKLKQLLAIISKNVPFKPSFTSMAVALSASRNNIADYLLYIEEAGLIGQLRDKTNGIKGLGKVEKFIWTIPTFFSALARTNQILAISAKLSF